MNIEKYKAFIDGVVLTKDSISASWVMRGFYPEVDENAERNKFLATLTEAQRMEISRMLQEEKESGIHDLLAFLVDHCEIKNQGSELASEPFGTELYYDFVCRANGDAWPMTSSSNSE